MLINMVHQLLGFGLQERSFSQENVARHGTSNANILKSCLIKVNESASAHHDVDLAICRGSNADDGKKNIRKVMSDTLFLYNFRHNQASLITETAFLHTC
jgi:uncharacterized protein Yka (UPF0111/DUF47 family)